MSLYLGFIGGFVLLFPIFWGLEQIATATSCTAAVAAELFATVISSMFFAMLLARFGIERKMERQEQKGANPYDFSVGVKPDNAIKSTKSMELAADNIKQFLTLTTAMLAVTSAMVVANQYIERSPCYVKICFFYAWVSQVVSIFFGVFAHMRVIGIVHFLERDTAGNVYDDFLTWSMKWQQVCFAAGLLFTVVCAVFVMNAPSTVSKDIGHGKASLTSPGNTSDVFEFLNNKA